MGLLNETQVNIGLGKGKAINEFNDRILNFQIGNKMESINSNDMRLIKELCTQRITKQEFENETKFKASYQQLVFLLDNTEKEVNLENNDNKYFSAIFWDLPDQLSLLESEYIFRKFLLKNWHHEHEEIAGSFQVFFNNDKDNIQVLLQSIKNIPKYLNRNDLKYSYVRKIIYAIGAQPEPYNIEALEELANKTDDDIIKDLSLHQIEKRKSLGRWESTKNVQ